VSALIALGADPNLRDNLGRTAIFAVADEEMLELLLAAGARADITGNDKRSPALFGSSDAIVLRLLEAGADPHGRARDPYGRSDHEGKTLREMAQDGEMPATLAWLDAHGVQ
jgi:ankyrin repeat protein